MDENLNNILSELECPVCSDYMHKEISVCESGHSICKICKDKCSACPVCKSRFGDTRNYTLEKVIDALKFSCKNKSLGCTVVLNPIEIYYHMQDCECETYTCPLAELTKCTWTGKTKLIKDHLKIIHANLNTRYNTQDISTSVSFISAFKTVFKVYRRYLSDIGLVQWAVQCVGSKYIAEHYLFRVDFFDHDDIGYELSMTANCIPLCKDDEAFDNSKLCIHEEMLKYYKVGNNYEHNLVILKKNK